MYIAAFRQRCVQMLLPGPNKGLHCLPHVDNTATLAGSIKGILGRAKLCTPLSRTAVRVLEPTIVQTVVWPRLF